MGLAYGLPEPSPLLRGLAQGSFSVRYEPVLGPCSLGQPTEQWPMSLHILLFNQAYIRTRELYH